MVEVSKLATAIGAGGFAAIYHIEDNAAIAIKVVKVHELTPFLDLEFEMMQSVYVNYRLENKLDQTPLLFHIPKPLYSSACDHSMAARWLFQELAATNASYAMERISSLPINLSQTLLQQVLGPRAPADKDIVLCRLYFGKDEIRTSKFFNSRNFPISASTYTTLASTQVDLPSQETVVFEMGRILAMIHSVGYDARDIEFVLAGKTNPENNIDAGHFPPSSTWGFHTFDFNQMRPLSNNGMISDDVQSMCDSFWLNDPYFPRPGSDLYEQFRNGYCTVRNNPKLVHAFFTSLEAEQARRSEARL